MGYENIEIIRDQPPQTPKSAGEYDDVALPENDEDPDNPGYAVVSSPNSPRPVLTQNAVPKMDTATQDGAGPDAVGIKKRDERVSELYAKPMKKKRDLNPMKEAGRKANKGRLTYDNVTLDVS